MPEFVGEAIDKLITVEAKNRGLPFGILEPLYQAARHQAGGRPLTMLAAQRLKEILKPGDTVLILTGCGAPPGLPKGESDGPPGAAVLARILYRGLGAVPVYVCEQPHCDPIIASSHACGLMVKTFDEAQRWRLGAAVATAPTNQSDVEGWARDILDLMNPKFIISTERFGPGRDGNMHKSTGQPVTGPQALEKGVIDISAIVVEAAKRAIPSLGLGDHGNEIGFGTIWQAVADTMPGGEITATVVKTDIVIPAMCSNWGCYGVEACLAFLLGQSELMHSSKEEERILRACLDAGGLEAQYCTSNFIVDGLDGETSMAIVHIMGSVIKKNLERPSLGLWNATK